MRNNSLTSRTLLAILAGTLTFPTAMAETREPTTASAVPDAPEIRMPDPSVDPDQATFDAVFKSLKEKRGPSGVAEVDESSMGADFDKFRKEFLKIKTADHLDAFIIKHNDPKQYEKHSPNIRFVVSQLALLKPYRSVVYRLRELLDKESNNVHSLTVTALKSVAAGLKIILPTAQWDAGFEYIVAPSAGDGMQQFKSVADFQAFLVRTDSEWSTAQNRIGDFLKTGPVFFDNKLSYGTAAFPDNIDRFRIIDTAEIYVLLSGMHMARYLTSFFIAYDHDQLFEFAEDMGRLTGLNGLLSTNMGAKVGRSLDFELGLSAYDRVEKVFRKKNRAGGLKYAKFLTLRPGRDGAYGKKAMNKAFYHLAKATEFSKKAWELVDNRPINRQHALPTAVIQAKRDRLSIQHKNSEALIKGRTTVRSPITSKEVVFDIPALYDAETVPTDLKAFLPTKFDMSAVNLNAVVEGKKVEYRNYYRGRAIGWNNKAFKNYVPSAEGQDSGYMIEALNTLAFSYEGDMLFAPIYMSIR